MKRWIYTISAPLNALILFNTVVIYEVCIKSNNIVLKIFEILADLRRELFFIEEMSDALQKKYVCNSHNVIFETNFKCTIHFKCQLSHYVT